MRRLRYTLPLCAALVAGCGGIQSVLEPRGSEAAWIAGLSWVMFAGASAIFLLVMVLTLIAMRARPAWLASRSAIVAGGVVFPAVTLTALLIYGLNVGRAVGRDARDAALRIEVVGEQYWWRVRYHGSEGRAEVLDANEIHLPVGRPVELVLRTGDVIHSFWVPQLAGKLDMIPGHTMRLRVRAEQPGTFRGQCAEYCGAQHAQMALHVVARPAAEFDAWLGRAGEPPAAPATPFLQHGRDVFMASGCGTCHAIRGTTANGVAGPDLTRVGSRQSLGAGMFPNNAGTLAGWIAGSQHLKPGNRMPSFGMLGGEELRALAAYLESLK